MDFQKKETNRNRFFYSLGLIVLGGFGPTFSIASKGGRIEFDRYVFIRLSKIRTLQMNDLNIFS